ncbi:hypothetical protein TNCV_2254831 [Trichonephila clavipes]|nr:hypothetical protein TNCV_2254831 [Trichonephila clavipes]
MLENVIENWTSRLDYIRASRGSPMPEIIFKMKMEHGEEDQISNSINHIRNLALLISSKCNELNGQIPCHNGRRPYHKKSSMPNQLAHGEETDGLMV